MSLSGEGGGAENVTRDKGGMTEDEMGRDSEDRKWSQTSAGYRKKGGQKGGREMGIA